MHCRLICISQKKHNPMIRKILLKVSVLFFSTSAGIVVAVIVVSPFVWYINMIANDGPIFPPPLVALGFFGLPYAFLLFPVQLIVALYEFFSGKSLGSYFPVLSIVNGLSAGLLWSYVLKSSETTAAFVLTLIGIALVQSFVVFGSYWLLERIAPMILDVVLKMPNLLKSPTHTL
jgi:hypothetical protein